MLSDQTLIYKEEESGINILLSHFVLLLDLTYSRGFLYLFSIDTLSAGHPQQIPDPHSILRKNNIQIQVHSTFIHFLIKHLPHATIISLFRSDGRNFAYQLTIKYFFPSRLLILDD